MTLNTKEIADKYVQIVLQEWVDEGGDPTLLIMRMAAFINEFRKRAGLEVSE